MIQFNFIIFIRILAQFVTKIIQGSQPLIYTTGNWFFLCVFNFSEGFFQLRIGKFAFSCRFWNNAQENNWTRRKTRISLLILKQRTGKYLNLQGKFTFPCRFWKNTQENHSNPQGNSHFLVSFERTHRKITQIFSCGLFSSKQIEIRKTFITFITSLYPQNTLPCQFVDFYNLISYYCNCYMIWR